MNKIKINLDREKLSSEYIHSKQDFSKVQNQVNMQTGIIKNAWFYGTVGLASVAAFVFITFNNLNTKTHDSTSTLRKKIITDTKQETLAERKSADVFLASVNDPNPPRNNLNGTLKKEVTRFTVSKGEEINQEKLVTNEVMKVQHPMVVAPLEMEKTPEKEKVNNFPRISGVYNGEISQSKLCGAGIEINSSVHVVNFSIHYSTSRGDKIQHIEGNKLPASICKEMQQYGIDQMIFITDITGTDKNGKLMNFTSMNLVAVME